MRRGGSGGGRQRTEGRVGVGRGVWEEVTFELLYFPAKSYCFSASWLRSVQHRIRVDNIKTTIDFITPSFDIEQYFKLGWKYLVSR